MKSYPYYCLILSCLAVVLALAMAAPTWIRLICAALLLGTIAVVLKESKCPVCGRHTVNINPQAKEFGICKQCGCKKED